MRCAMCEVRGVRFEAVFFEMTPGEACLRLERWTWKGSHLPIVKGTCEAGVVWSGPV